MSHLAFARVLPGILMLFSACLVTSSPTFEESLPTKPFLDFESAQPDPRTVLTIASGEEKRTFSAKVRSEDDPDDPVKVRLLLDYGYCNGGLPFRFLLREGADVDPSTFDDLDRTAVVDAQLLGLELEPGCHRLTMMVSHEFDPRTGCPADPDDFSQITWTIRTCEGDCQLFDPDQCPPVQASCSKPCDTVEQ